MEHIYNTQEAIEFGLLVMLIGRESRGQTYAANFRGAPKRARLGNNQPALTPRSRNRRIVGVIMPRMKRKDALAAIRVAGYHDDTEGGFHLYLKNWVSMEAFGREFNAGVAMRQNGVRCDCIRCTKDEQEAAPRPFSVAVEPSRAGGSSARRTAPWLR